LFTVALRKRLTAASVVVMAVPPRTVDTFTQDLPFPLFWKALSYPWVISTEQGSLASCIAAAGPEVRIESSKHI
jgi:hypothetical protein